MKVAITEIFCEIITGLALTLVILACLDWPGIITFEDVLETVKSSFGVTSLTTVLIAAYLLGVVLDAAGLVFDNVFHKVICADEPSSEEVKNFWRTADAHVLAYRDNVWAYYFCYRNLLMLTIPAIICWFGSLWQRGLRGWACSVAVALVGMGIVLFFSMRTLLKLYYNITKSF